MNIMASGPITSWQIDRGKVETVTDFIFFGSKITVDSDWSHEIKDTYFLEDKLGQTREHIKKQRHHLVNKVHIIKAMIFPVVMYGCKIWIIKKAEH